MVCGGEDLDLVVLYSPEQIDFLSTELGKKLVTVFQARLGLSRWETEYLMRKSLALTDSAQTVRRQVGWHVRVEYADIGEFRLPLRIFEAGPGEHYWE